VGHPFKQKMVTPSFNILLLLTSFLAVCYPIQLPVLQVQQQRIFNSAFRGAPLQGKPCEFIQLCNVIDNSGCEDGTKFVIKGNTTDVRKQFYILNGLVIIGLSTKEIPFGDCSVFVEVTPEVQCKVPGNWDGATISLSSESEIEMEETSEGEIEIPVLRSKQKEEKKEATLTATVCEYIKLCDLVSNSNCTGENRGENNAQSFFIETRDNFRSDEKEKDPTKIRKQLLILDGTAVLAFYSGNNSFSSCTDPIQVTAKVNCMDAAGNFTGDFQYVEPNKGRYKDGACRNLNGIFPHPQDCQKYFICGNGYAHEYTCAGGTLFRTDSQFCDWEENVQCNNRR